jgi:hypothetical protein
MFQNLRFVVLVLGGFVLAYFGAVWIKVGAPIPTLTASSPKPDSRVQAVPESTEQGMRKEGDGAKTLQSDGDIVRDKLRLAAMTAGNAYSLSPCDRAAKANFVAALAAYAKAWRDKMGCGFGGCDQKKLEAAGVAFSTPLDLRVHEVIRTAFDKGGISIDDFPPPLRENVAMLARGRGDPATACAARAERMG